MQKHITTSAHRNNSSDLNPAIEAAVEVGQKVMDVVQDGAIYAGEKTEKAVKKYPLAAVGISLGTGIALGAIGYKMFAPKPRIRFIEKLGLTALGATAARAVSKYF